MPADFHYTLGDTASVLQETFSDGDGTAVNLTGAEVTLRLRHMATGERVGPLSMTIDTPLSGVVSYRFLGTELVDDAEADVPGGWWYQCKATLGSGRTIHIPNDPGQWKMLLAAEPVEG